MCGNCKESCGPAHAPYVRMILVLWLKLWIMVDWMCRQSTEQQLQDVVAKNCILIYWHLDESKCVIMREQDISSSKLERKRLCKIHSRWRHFVREKKYSLEHK